MKKEVLISNGKTKKEEPVQKETQDKQEKQPEKTEKIEKKKSKLEGLFG